MSLVQGLGARGLIVRPLVLVVRLYQRWISPMRPPTCRFHPSCSAYAVTALETHGLFRGTWLSSRRLLRCHPWNPGGVDHVPGTSAAAAWAREEAERSVGREAPVSARHTHDCSVRSGTGV